jgi:hypothetical protein
MRKYKVEIFLSSKILSDYKQVPREEAEKWLDDHGYKFVYIGDDGAIHARSQNNRLIEGYRLYMREVPDV